MKSTPRSLSEKSTVSKSTINDGSSVKIEKLSLSTVAEEVPHQLKKEPLLTSSLSQGMQSRPTSAAAVNQKIPVEELYRKMEKAQNRVSRQSSLDSLPKVPETVVENPEAKVVANSKKKNPEWVI